MNILWVDSGVQRENAGQHSILILSISQMDEQFSYPFAPRNAMYRLVDMKGMLCSCITGSNILEDLFPLPHVVLVI